MLPGTLTATATTEQPVTELSCKLPVRQPIERGKSLKLRIAKLEPKLANRLTDDRQMPQDPEPDLDLSAVRSTFLGY